MRLAKINTCLLILILLVNGYVLLAPFTPQLLFWWQSRHTQRQAQLTAQLHQPSSVTAPSPDTAVAQSNQLIMPAMLLDQPILEGSIANTYKTLDKGIWRWPKGSTPDKGGNTVLIGHRFTYTKPKGVFYFLNKMQIGDEIGVVWEGTTYRYRVSEVKVVPPTEVSIENPTSDARLTIFTCTPLWLPKDRLVVIATREAS